MFLVYLSAVSKPNLMDNSGNTLTSPNLDSDVRKLLSRVIRKSHEKRVSIAQQLSAALDYPVTVVMLDGFSAPSKAARFPAAWVPAFCEVLGNYELQRLLLSPRLSLLLKLGDLSLDVARNEKEMEALRAQLLSTESPKSEKHQSSSIRAPRDISAVTSRKKGERI